MESHWNATCFPPSPFSTQPNTPLSAGESSPEHHLGSATSDGGSDYCDGELSNHWGKHRLLSGCRDQWIKPIGRIRADRSVIDNDDVDQPNVSDHHRRADAGPGDVSEPSNGHITHNGNELNAIVEGQKKASMQMERGL